MAIKKNLFCSVLFFVAYTLFHSHTYAGWKTDVGYKLFADYLGNDLHDGTGLRVCQTEVAVNLDVTSSWMPDPNSTAFSEKFLNDLSRSPDGIYSSHATVVGQILYGDATAMAPGIVDINVYYAGHWKSKGYLYYGHSRQLAVTDCRLANHGWVGAGFYNDEETSALLRRLDCAVDRDEYIQTAGLTNSTSSTRPLLASTFNVIDVVCTDGSHSRGCSAVDDIYTADRVRPSVVVSQTATSHPTQVVGAAVAMMIQAGYGNPALSTDPEQTYVTN